MPYGGGHDASSEADSTCSLRVIDMRKISGWTQGPAVRNIGQP